MKQDKGLSATMGIHCFLLNLNYKDINIKLKILVTEWLNSRFFPV